MRHVTHIPSATVNTASPFEHDGLDTLWQRTGRTRRTWLIDPAIFSRHDVECALAALPGAHVDWAGRVFDDGAGGFLITLELPVGWLQRVERSAQFAAARRASALPAQVAPLIRLERCLLPGLSLAQDDDHWAHDDLDDLGHLIESHFAVLGIDASWPPTWLAWETTCALCDTFAEHLREER